MSIRTFTTTRPVPNPYEPLLLKPALDQLATGAQPIERGPDDFPIFDADPLAPAHRLLSRFIAHAALKYHLPNPRAANVRDFDGASEMLDAPPERRFEYVLAAVTRELWFWKHGVHAEPGGWHYQDPPHRFALPMLIKALLKGFRGPIPRDLTKPLLDALTVPLVGEHVRWLCPIDAILPILAATLARDGIDNDIHRSLHALRGVINHYPDWGAEAREKQKLLDLLDQILNPNLKKPLPPVVDAGEPWADGVLSRLTLLSDSARETWLALFAHAESASGAQPTQKWLKAATKLATAIGLESLEPSLANWFELMTQPRTHPLTELQMREKSIGFDFAANADLFTRRNETIIKGLLWLAGSLDRPDLAAPIATLAERSYKKIPQIGPRSPVVGNACLVALAMMNNPQAAAQLSRLKAVVKQPTGRKMIERALARLATRLNVTAEDLEEQSIPTFGLRDGVITRAFGPVTLTVTLSPRAELTQSWHVDGKARKSPPAEIKSTHADALKSLKRELTDLTKTLASQRPRLERLFLRRTPWSIDAWRSAYHDHPLVRCFARRLIWAFTTGDAAPVPAAWDGQRFIDASDRPVPVDTGSTVHLWHPSSASADQVLAWRQWLERHQVTQPFKQAHREIYPLTDAERTTATYSNRFAAHVLRQHQFQALAQQRGWRYQLMGSFDFHNVPTLTVAPWNTRVEFWVEVATDTTVAASGIANYLSTDQVRFYDNTTGVQLHLEEVPPLLFSEIMRDVDLFVGVASVGNDPAWRDGGPEGRFREYFTAFSEAPLTEGGAIRRQILETLLPRLTKLQGRWSLDDRHLVVRGSIRTYKIHLGSGNILMEPNNAYLCIVQDRSRNDDAFFLPFEGDATFSLILSKAFLLAEDQKIKDPTITRQLGR